MFKRQWSDKEIDHPHALDAYPGAFKNELKRCYAEIERLQGLVERARKIISLDHDDCEEKGLIATSNKYKAWLKDAEGK